MNEEGGSRRLPRPTAATQSSRQHRHSCGRTRGERLYRRALTLQFELEKTIDELAAVGDPQRLAAAVWLASARTDFHLTRRHQCVLEEWGFAA